MLPKNIYKWLEPEAWDARDPIYCSAVFIDFSSGYKKRGESLTFSLLRAQKRKKKPKIKIFIYFLIYLLLPLSLRNVFVQRT